MDEVLDKCHHSIHANTGRAKLNEILNTLTRALSSSPEDYSASSRYRAIMSLKSTAGVGGV